MAERVRRSASTLTKGDRSPVTVADYAVQALVGRRLKDAFPGEPLVAEEESGALKKAENTWLLDEVVQAVGEGSREDVCAWIDAGRAGAEDRFWTLDPIDGTRGFLRGDQYAVCLALIVSGKVELSVMGCPNLDLEAVDGHGVLVAAARGRGCWARRLGGDAWTRLSVSGRTGDLIALRSFESRHTDEARVNEILERLGVRRAPLLMDSQAKYVVLAAGEGDLLLRIIPDPEYHEKVWDQAPGYLAVVEAGGRMTDLDGKELDFGAGRSLSRNHGVLAANGSILERVVEAARATRVG